MKLHPDVTNKLAIANFEGLEDTFNKIHSNKYDYSQAVYVDSKTKMSIICPIHGEFEQRSSRHQVSGCPKCGITQRGINAAYTTKEFIEKAKITHKDKNYLYTETVYTKSQNNVTVCCSKHGNFSQIASAHLGGQGCPECGTERAAIIARKTEDNFIAEANKIHKFEYTYTNTGYVDRRTPIKITCKLHGVFSQQPDAHLSGQKCPHCAEIATQLRNSDKLTRLYYIKIQQDHMEKPVYKIGITCNSVEERFRSKLDKDCYEVLWESKPMSREKAVTKEQDIVVRNKKYRYIGNMVRKPTGEVYNSAELFTKDIRKEKENKC